MDKIKFLDMQMDYYRSIKDSEDDNWSDKKIHRENIRFPNHGEDRVYPVTITYVSELNNKVM